ncbi:MAG: UDP-N-acetylmuramoyl-tripeptide--D-alanyl-D-alanine ligase [Alphaproteobacteria bacterium]|nr:UDP-N-acetylmuramoyl-tripeptide--D-alanyl-D-alanine ligase [Alphaproteobacteria bacterium]
MSPLWTASEIAEATGGVASAAFSVSGVTFDSREVGGGELFVALRGERTDGHRFVETAVRQGAEGLLVSEPVPTPHVRVADTMAGLEAMGRAARARAAATVIGVTGSVGKTGVKEAIRLSLERFAAGSVHASVKSYNNHTGVPLSLARMPRETRFGVFEMGMNHAGEIAALTRQVRPHVAVITWVASVHIEFFDSEAGIADAKAEIVEGLEPGGTAILPWDNAHRDRLIAAATAHGARVVTFGEGQGADVRALRYALHPDCTTVTAQVHDETLTYKIGMAGRHWVNNSLAVIAAVKAAGGDIAMAGLALAELSDLPGRGRRARINLRDGGQAVVIDESYNANPTSMAATLAVLGSTAPQGKGRRIAVLGAMKELGEGSPGYHAGLAQPVIDAGVDHAVLVGAEMEPLHDALRKRVRSEHVSDFGAAIESVDALLRPDDVVLVKGSNSVGLGLLVRHMLGGDA